MRVLAIGDIHGCSVALDTLLRLVAPTPADLLITLGDVVDRGPDSAGVVERLLALQGTGRLIALRGNHDEMMTDARSGLDTRMWLGCGGRATLASYGIDYFTANAMELVPEEHWDFLENRLLDWYELDTHFFVHGNADPDLPLDQQPRDLLLWEKLVDHGPHCSGKIQVCGHTRQLSGEPLNLGHIVCIDTGAYDDEGWLTCLEVRTGRYWQANQQGEHREGQLGPADASLGW